MNFGLARKDRIAKLENKVQRVATALKTYPYTNPRDYLEDLASLESFQKELEIQQAYSQLESNLH
jgi:hypothetical protein